MRLPALRLSLRVKVLGVALVLLAIPVVGYDYLNAMEAILQEGQAQTVMGTARAVATALHDRPRLLELRAAPPAETPEPLGDPTAIPPIVTDTHAASEEIQLILRGLGRTTSRIWVVDRKLNLLAIAGSLAQPTPARAETGWTDALVAPVRRLLERMLRRAPETHDEILSGDVLSGSPEISSALDGVPASRTRPAADNRTAVISAAHPIWYGEEVIGAVVVEETTDAIRSLSTDALARLAVATIVAFLLGTATLLAFASRLSFRLRTLRDEADAAIDSQGRIRQLLSGSTARDEIGDLSRGFSTVLERLSQYNAYLESMASRLSHELRTPIAVVRSSLDNLRAQALDASARTYIDRADSGLQRLSLLLTRMAEATRLEATIRDVERERFDADAVTAACVAGYAAAYPNHRIEYRGAGEPVWLNGAPDLLAQMLDKLIANAVDFSPREAPIVVRLERLEGEARLSVFNAGPPLPAEIAGRLFTSMVSARKDQGGEPHLGLGLYIVRLVSEFHGGSVRAENQPDGSGVTFTVILPAPGPGQHA